MKTSGVVAVVLLAGCGQSPVTTSGAVVGWEPHTVISTRPAVQPRPVASHASRGRHVEVVLSGAAGWASTGAARAVAFCESGQDNSARSHTGKYRGKWQMDADFWRTYGGLQYAPSPDLASETEQDAVAYRGWLARGWQPWECARIVGVR